MKYLSISPYTRKRSIVRVCVCCILWGSVLGGLSIQAWAESETSKSSALASKNTGQGKSLVEQLPESVHLANSASKQLCYVGQYKTKITPKQIRIFLTTSQGEVSHLIDPRERVLSGTVFGKVNEKEMQIEKEDMEVALLKDRVAKKDDILKMRREKRELQFLMKLTPSERNYISKQSDKKVMDRDVLKGIDDKIDLAEREIKILEKKKRAEFEKKEKANIFTMPFDGRLQYQFTLPENPDQATQFLESGKELAVACDDSEFYLSIIISDPEIVRIEPQDFVLEMRLGNGELMRGTFSHKRTEKSQSGQGESLAFFFKIEAKNHEKAFSLIGSNLVAKLYYRPPFPVQLMSKLSLGARPEAKGTSTWQELLDRIMPGHEVVLVGETQIIVRKK
ncbi:MAG: hypothetical protein RSE01_08760 [Akkermansia sp.]